MSGALAVCFASIFSWLCGGSEFVKDCARQRSQATDACGDRFVDETQKLNSAVERWLIQLFVLHQTFGFGTGSITCGCNAK